MKTFETFKNIDNYIERNLILSEPSAFNGIIRVRKYRVTIEEVEEPIEVIHERLQKLWDECDNYHYWNHIKQEATKFGYELKGNVGSKRKKK